MKFNRLYQATFIERRNRFTVVVDLNGGPVEAHMANSGRLKDLLVRGRTVYLVKKDEPQRKTKYDIVLASLDTGLVSVDARLPCDLVEEALIECRLEPFREYACFQREVTFGDSRLDFKLENERTYLLEIKSVTKVRNGTAMFPDAVTARGSRHVRTLLEARNQGYEAAVAFIAQREDVERFSPDDETDPAFGETLRDAAARGLDIFAFKCQVSLKEIRIAGPIPVVL